MPAWRPSPARAGVEGAALNVRINLGGIADAAFKARASEAVAALEADARRLCDAVLARVAATIRLTPAYIRTALSPIASSSMNPPLSGVELEARRLLRHQVLELLAEPLDATCRRWPRASPFRAGP